MQWVSHDASETLPFQKERMEIPKQFQSRLNKDLVRGYSWSDLVLTSFVDI